MTTAQNNRQNAVNACRCQKQNKRNLRLAIDQPPLAAA
jgi:hypothetical protein